MANAWKKPQSILPWTRLFFVFPIFLIFLYFLLKSSNPKSNIPLSSTHAVFSPSSFPIPPFDCVTCPQASPVFASFVEGVKYPFLYSLADIGNPEKPHKNIVRMLKRKHFRKPNISVTIQETLEKLRSNGRGGAVIDVGANVGLATFAATAMGFRVFAFEPVFENLQRICDGILLNRAASLVTLFEAAASDSRGNVTFYKLVGRLDNSAISETGAELAFKSNEKIASQVRTIPLDEMIPESMSVLLLKIDVQGWEYHVLKGALRLLSRKESEAPYIIYEEDERLLQASNSSVSEIKDFLYSVGYRHCIRHGGDSHCTKTM